MLKLLRLLLAFVAGVVIVLFTVANRGTVAVSFWPIPVSNFRWWPFPPSETIANYGIDAPLFAVFLFGVVLGVIVGGIAVRLALWHAQSEARLNKERLEAIEARRALDRAMKEKEQMQRFRERRERSGGKSLAAF